MRKSLLTANTPKGFKYVHGYEARHVITVMLAASLVDNRIERWTKVRERLNG